MTPLYYVYPHIIKSLAIYTHLGITNHAVSH